MVVSIQKSSPIATILSRIRYLTALPRTPNAWRSSRRSCRRSLRRSRNPTCFSSHVTSRRSDARLRLLPRQDAVVGLFGILGVGELLADEVDLDPVDGARERVLGAARVVVGHR